MTQPTTPESDPRRSVLQQVAARIGAAPRVSLSESGSEHGVSPLVAPGAVAQLVPQGRDKYQLAGEIARGGMGVILRGFDTDLGRDVAFKVLDGELAKRPEVVRRFVEEAQIGGQLQHPGIVPVYELGLMADQSPFFTMKLVKGRTLAALLKGRKSPAENRGRLLAIFESVCQTMAYAHSKGVLHRDLKPANIMVGAFGEVQVVDWGLAKVLHRGGVADERRARETVHTVIETVRSGPGSGGSDSMVGSVMGTPAYMAPEQAQGELEKLDERADVFSLGAILCELLTGKPPYEGVEGEKTVVRAARARLDPARARIEACEADAVLKELCLDCLRPARDARPANADEVAKAVHAYLTSTEERAHAAELAAAEARVKAAEERRRRRLAVALGATVIAALTLGGGGSWWVAHERDRRSAGVRAAVEQAHGEGVQLAQAGKHQEALAAAVRALDLARTGGADAALIARAEAFRAKAEQDLSAAQGERDLRDRDQRLLARLIDLRLDQLDSVGDSKRERELDGEFAQAFLDYGVDLEAEDIVPAFERLRDRGIDREVALALDDWGRLRRRVHGLHSRLAENVLYLAMDLDPDPERTRLRQAIFEDDKSVLLELGAPEQLHKLEPGSVWVLSATLWDRFPEERPAVFRLFESALSLYPQDFLLQSIGGRIYQDSGRLDVALGCRQVAQGLRPGRARSRRDVAETLYFLGRLTESHAAFRAAVALDDSVAETHYGLGMTRLQLGDLQGAHESLERALELRPDDRGVQADARVVRYFLGLEPRSEIERAAVEEPSSLIQGTYLFALLDHPDPAQRDPGLVLRVLAEEASFYSARNWGSVIEVVALVRLGEWAQAQVLLERTFADMNVMLLTPNALEFLRSLVHAEVGQDEAARECHGRAMAEWELRTRDDPAAWERSDVMRWRRAAEEALAR